MLTHFYIDNFKSLVDFNLPPALCQGIDRVCGAYTP